MLLSSYHHLVWLALIGNNSVLTSFSTLSEIKTLPPARKYQRKSRNWPNTLLIPVFKSLGMNCQWIGVQIYLKFDPYLYLMFLL